MRINKLSTSRPHDVACCSKRSLGRRRNHSWFTSPATRQWRPQPCPLAARPLLDHSPQPHAAASWAACAWPRWQSAPSAPGRAAPAPQQMKQLDCRTTCTLLMRQIRKRMCLMRVRRAGLMGVKEATLLKSTRETRAQPSTSSGSSSSLLPCDHQTSAQQLGKSPVKVPLTELPSAHLTCTGAACPLRQLLQH